jgi:flagellin-like hook-associated protein FlgL
VRDWWHRQARRGPSGLAGNAAGTGVDPFALDASGKAIYTPDTPTAQTDATDTPEMHIGEDTTISAYAVPSENRQVRDLLNKMIDLRDAMNSKDSASVIALRDDLAAQEDLILSSLSRAGTTQYRLETAMKDLEVRYEGTEKLISTDADVDFAEATVRLNRAQMAYQAAIQSGAMIQNNSLLDYLR